MGLFGNIFDNSKKYEDEINLLQKKLSKANAVNVSIEERLAEKDLDIGKADKSVQKIIQIWRNINSSESLPKILSTIIRGLSTDLDFLYCLLFQIYKDKDGIKLKVSIASDVAYFNIDELIGNKLKTFSIPYECADNSLINAIKSQTIQQMAHFHDIFKGSDLILEKHTIDRLESIFIDRAITVLPITVQNNPFGCLVAVSLKEEVDSMEQNYLKLFAGQIELSISMTRLLESVKTLAVTDALTGLYNRRHFDETLIKEMKRSQRTKYPFTIITLDLDHLKRINDTYGHSAGDAAIAAIGNVLLKNARETDIAARFGGEEFALIMPNTDLEGGIVLAERIRAIIESKKVEGVGTITASIGVATYLKHANTIEDLLKIVDQAMYKAKENGRNRVEVAKTILRPDIQAEFL